MQDGLHLIGKEAEELGDPNKVWEFKDPTFVKKDKAISRSGTKLPKVTYHGTSPDKFLAIVKSGGSEIAAEIEKDGFQKFQ